MSQVRLDLWILMYIQFIIILCKVLPIILLLWMPWSILYLLWRDSSLYLENSKCNGFVSWHILWEVLPLSLCSCSNFWSVKMCSIRKNQFSFSNLLSLFNLAIWIISCHLMVLPQKAIWRVSLSWNSASFCDSILSKAFCFWRSSSPRNII